ncbi:MAG: hypothetical protein ACE5FT_03925 [Candidatus Nanoarchaeia archaeon]
MLYFITGTSGAGKSLLVGNLQKLLPDARIHDFDEGGVPHGACPAWRREQTEYWLQQAKDYNGLFVVCGITVPQEIMKSPSYRESMNARYGLLKIPEEVIRKKLALRNWSAERLDSDVNWALHMEKFVKEVDGRIFDGTQSP